MKQSDYSGDLSITFFVDGSEVAAAGAYSMAEPHVYSQPASALCVHSPATTSATTYAVFYKASAGTSTFNTTPARVVFTVTELSS